MPRDLPILAIACKLAVIDSSLVRDEELIANDRSGRITRRRLATMTNDGYLRRLGMQVVSAADGMPRHVYIPTDKGRHEAAQLLNSPEYVRAPTSIDKPHHLQHYLEVSRTLNIVSKSVARNTELALSVMVTEHHWLPPLLNEKKPRKLAVCFGQSPARYCRPDGAFVIECRGHRRIFYLEENRKDHYSHKRISETKVPPYRMLHQRRLHLDHHFPDANGDRFTVLCVCPSKQRKTAFVEAFRKHDDEGFWLFAAKEDLTPDSFFTEPVWQSPISSDAEPLLRFEARACA